MTRKEITLLEPVGGFFVQRICREKAREMDSAQPSHRTANAEGRSCVAASKFARLGRATAQSGHGSRRGGAVPQVRAVVVVAERRTYPLVEYGTTQAHPLGASLRASVR